MKTFFYTRLYDLDKDYGFYISPHNPIGSLVKAVATEDFNARKKLLFLESHNGNYTFGVRELLSLRDEKGRLILHFTGFQLDAGASAILIPTYDELKRHFAEITAEAYVAHELLNAKRQEIPNPYISNVAFDAGVADKNISWDQTRHRLINTPSQDAICVFDEHGQELQISDLLKTQDVLKSPSQEPSLGTSWAGLRPSDDDTPQRPRTFVPPLRFDDDGDKGLLSRLWGTVETLPKRVINRVYSSHKKPREP